MSGASETRFNGENVGTRLSEDLANLLVDETALTLREIEFRLKGRGYALLTMLLSVPFLVPNIPGLSTPFGIAIALIGGRVALGKAPWLPKFILDREISYKTLKKMVSLLVKAVTKIERWVKPRMVWVVSLPGMRELAGFGVFLGGVFLLLPLPIPFTNSLPALSILFLTLGMMDRDGLLVIAGWIIGIASWLYLAAWIYLGAELILLLETHFPTVRKILTLDFSFF